MLGFDCSGTLLHDIDQVYHATCKLHEECGIPSPSLKEWKMFPKSSIIEYAKWKNFPISSEIAFSHLASHYLENPSCPEPYPSVVEALELASKHFQLAVVSYHPNDCLIRDLTESHIIEFFKFVSGGQEPKEDRIRKIEPKVMCYIGDMASDVRAANLAGVLPICVGTGYQNINELRELAPSFSTLLEAVQFAIYLKSKS